MLSRIGAVGLLSGVLVLGALAAPSFGEETPVATLADGRAGKIHFESQPPAGYFGRVRHGDRPRQRIGVIGFSKGGQVALYSALEPFRRAVIADDRRFAAEGVTGAPMLFLLCGRDDSDRSPRFVRELVTGRGCNMAVDLDRFTVKIRGTGEDIPTSAARYGRDCLARGATIGGDSEAKRRAPEDVAAFLRSVFGL